MSAATGVAAIIDHIRVLQSSPQRWLVRIDKPTSPKFVCPEAPRHPSSARAVVKNQSGAQLRVRATVRPPAEERFPHSTISIRVELDVDTISYPSERNLPRLWIRSSLFGSSHDGCLHHDFYSSIRNHKHRERNIIETVLWFFVHHYLVGDGRKIDADGHGKLRFRVGDRVLANMGHWEPGVVVALWDGGFPYRIHLDGTGNEVHAPFDLDEAVKAANTDMNLRSEASKNEGNDKAWPEVAMLPRNAWFNNLCRWEQARKLSQGSLESIFFEIGQQHHWQKKLDSRVVSWLVSGGQETPSFAEEISPNVFSFQLLSLEFCGNLVAEFERAEAQALAEGINLSRPNSMNKGGAILSELGMEPLMNAFQDEVLSPISASLFPVVGSELTEHHSFLVHYLPTEDRGLDMHTDDSDITFNICLGKQFGGSGLQFCGVLGDKDHRQATVKYAHKAGRCVVHLGVQRHGADVITSGERINLICWNRNKVWRRSSGYLHPMHQIRYAKESGPPDKVCLSWTHDVDWEVFRGSRPEGHSHPWCPPNLAMYDEREA